MQRVLIGASLLVGSLMALACGNDETGEPVTVRVDPGVTSVHLYDGEIAPENLVGVVTTDGRVTSTVIMVPAGQELTLLTDESPMQLRYASTVTLSGPAEVRVGDDFSIAWTLAAVGDGGAPR